MQRNCHVCKKEIAVYACACKNPPVLLCNNHSHFRLSSALHQQTYIYREITIEDCKRAQLSCQNALIKLESIKKANFKIFTELFKTIKREFAIIEENIRKAKLRIGKMMQYLNTYSYIVSFIEPTQDEKEVIALLNTGYVYLPEPANLIPIFDSFKTYIESNILYNDKMILPIPNSKVVFTIDLETFKTEKFMSSCQEFSYGYGFSLLPNKNFLIYGGALCMISKKPKQFLMTDVSILVNPYTRTTKMLSEGTQKSDMGNGTYLNGCVYVFGGFNSECIDLASCEKYLCKENKWVSINHLPEPIGVSASASFNDSIYICGKYTSSVYVYRPTADCYSLGATVSGKEKILLTTKNYIVMLQGRNTFVNHKNEFILYNYSDIEINSMLICPFIEKENFIYFLLGKYNFKNGKIIGVKLLRLEISSLITKIVWDILNIN